MNHTFIMLKYVKISHYKIKKILNCFVEDFTSTKTATLIKLSRNTINEYYKKFRKILLALLVNNIKKNTSNSTYIGQVKGEYGPKLYLKVYKVTPSFFFFTNPTKEAIDHQNPYQDEDFNLFARFAAKRFAKFYGFAKESYFSQIGESIARYMYSKEELFYHIWKALKINDKKYKNSDTFSIRKTTII